MVGKEEWMKDFVNLHVHTNIGSQLDALADVNDLFKKAKEFGQKAMAITDHGTLAGHLDAYKASKKTGVKFIPGCEFYFVNSYGIIEEPSKKGKKKTERRKHLILLAYNEVGYKNLLKANFIGFQNHVVSMGRVFPRISWDIIEKYSDGLICTSACLNGPLSVLIKNDQIDDAEKLAQRFYNMFKERFYIELQPHLLKDGDLDQNLTNKKLITIAQKFGIPLVCATDIHYLSKNSEKYHDVLMALNAKALVDDPSRHRYGIDEFYVKSGEEVFEFLKKHYGEEVALESINNTIKIADMCEEPTYIIPDKNHLPIFDPKKEKDYNEFLIWQKKNNIENLKEDAAFMRFRIFKGFFTKFKDLPKEIAKERFDRVKKEISVFEKNNFSSYMLIVADFINWAKENNILVGPGRGSVGGSLVAYLLEIHSVDPIEYGLLFERFQNSEKKDLPDIDVDFTSAGRDLVQEYCRNKYGADHCAHVSNINTYTPKNVIPDLVKSMRNIMPELVPEGTNYVQVSEAIKAVIPDVDGEDKKVTTLEHAMSLSAKLKEFSDKCPELMEYADAIVGLPKEFSTHAAGMVISDIPIIEFAPLRVDKNGSVAVQFEKNRCEDVGLVKIDFLAISTLDIIDETFKNIKRLGISGPASVEDIPHDDIEVFKMIQQGFTRCVFQLGKSGEMINLCKKIRPQNILDLAVINALARPSCEEQRQEYIDRRFANKTISYIHPSLENGLKQTFGVGVFEEQLMTLAKDVANWDLNKADGLRKLTKLKGKDPKFVLKLEADFLEGAMKTHNMSYEKAKEIWDRVISPFAGYGFNRSHAVFYSINGYNTAYLKRHFPAAFMAAYLKIKTSRGGLNKDEEIAVAKSECRRLGVKILPPDINRSSSGYEVLDQNTIVMGLSAIKGMGEKAVNEIISNQPFDSFALFLEKTSGRVINKSKLEALAKAGCFDSLKISRKDVSELGKKTRERFNLWLKKAEMLDGYKSREEFDLKFTGEEWGVQEILRCEQEVLGELVSGNLNNLFPKFFTGIQTTPLSNLRILPDRHEIIVEVLVQAKIREFKIKKENSKYLGQIMMKYRVVDINGIETELTIWPSETKNFKKLIGDGGIPIRAKCQVSNYNGTNTLMLRELQRVYGKIID